MNIIDKNKQDLSLIANAIREKTGLTEKFHYEEIPLLIDVIDDNPIGDEVLDSIIEQTVTSFNPVDYEMTTIPSYFFDGCTELTDFDFTTVTSIGKRSFANTGLTEINKNLTFRIPDYAFYNCNSLKSYKIDENKTISPSIGSYAFANCADFPYPCNADTIYKYAFYGNLGTLFSARVDVIQNGAFFNCNNLEEIYISFSNSLFSFDISQKSASLKKLTFYYRSSSGQGKSCCYSNYTCSNLKILKCIYTYPSFSGNATTYPSLEKLYLNYPSVVPLPSSFTWITGTKIAKGEGFIYVPEKLIEEYKNATNWAQYAEQIRPLSEYSDTTEVNEQ